jgi:hypothetical protein
MLGEVIVAKLIRLTFDRKTCKKTINMFTHKINYLLPIVGNLILKISRLAPFQKGLYIIGINVLPLVI